MLGGKPRPEDRAGPRAGGGKIRLETDQFRSERSGGLATTKLKITSALYGSTLTSTPTPPPAVRGGSESRFLHLRNGRLQQGAGDLAPEKNRRGLRPNLLRHVEEFSQGDRPSKEK